MSATTPSRVGLVNNTGTDYTELFLKKFAGEVLTTFETENVFKPLPYRSNYLQRQVGSIPCDGRGWSQLPRCG